MQRVIFDQNGPLKLVLGFRPPPNVLAGLAVKDLDTHIDARVATASPQDVIGWRYKLRRSSGDFD